ncbi:peptidyl-prolyl cis-trans isomerase [Desulfosediminicola ganghwensis]|uniref:peptidylprolyl isomerase n=1 Tax=Desulfosediminicola ganghwensis TaxID=2569540 RepID=UPI001C3C740D|nr:peptidylprolyl isomerase [Desulfosediminicola ganghwensis]
MKKILNDPLLHFFAIGCLLFLVFEYFGSAGEDEDLTIRVSSGDIKALEASFSRTWQRQPSREELDGLIDEKVRDEIAYREAVALGLDRDDAYIRRRLRMKMELLVEDITTAVPPTDEELKAYLEENRQAFRQEMRLAFNHVYLNPDQHGTTLDTDIQRLLEELDRKGEQADPRMYGDAIMLPRIYSLSSANVIDRQYGAGFSKELAGMETGRWQGPVRSSYGLHLVLVRQKKEAHAPELKEVRAAVERELMSARRQEVRKQTYDTLLDKYSIVVSRDNGVRD